jgi:hypothetical protein
VEENLAMVSGLEARVAELRANQAAEAVELRAERPEPKTWSLSFDGLESGVRRTVVPALDSDDVVVGEARWDERTTIVDVHANSGRAMSQQFDIILSDAKVHWRRTVRVGVKEFRQGDLGIVVVHER